MLPVRRLILLGSALLAARSTWGCGETANPLVSGGPDCIYIINAPKKTGGCCPTLKEAAQYVIDNTEDDLIAYYPLDTDASDQSGNDRDGVDVGTATYGSEDAICGGSRFFNGASKIDVEAFSGFTWGDQFSVSIWFKRTGQFGNYQGVVSNGYGSHGSWEIRMGRENGGKMLGGGVVTTNSAAIWNYVNLEASTDEWHHVVMTYDGSALKYYLDGVAQSGSAGCCSGPILPRDNAVTIGQAGVGSSVEYFYGYIDEVKLFKKYLSPDEVKQLYECPC